MPSTSISFDEADVTKLVLEFLTNRELNISMLSLERETGVINGVYSDDMLFLRQLILDGRWEDVIDFIQPLSSVGTFDLKRFQYVVYRYKYLELLCIRSESTPAPNYDSTVDELVRCMSCLELLCPLKDEYDNLCLLLTLPRLSDHPDYLNWNPSIGRVQCFAELFPVVEKFLPLDERDARYESRLGVAKDDRLIQLVVKGLLYESCAEYCQHKATNAKHEVQSPANVSVLNGAGFSDTDTSLLSWLQAIPHEIFSCPFAQKSLKLEVVPLQKPLLEASWTEQILTTPIKPKLFPHSEIPASRRSLDFFTQSLVPRCDGLSCGLVTGRDSAEGLLSKSFAGFHLDAGTEQLWHASVSKLFRGGKIVAAEGEPRFGMLKSSAVTDLSVRSQTTPQTTQDFAETSSKQFETSSVALLRMKEVPLAIARSATDLTTANQSSFALYKLYQKQMQEELAERERERERQRQIYRKEILEADECYHVRSVFDDVKSSIQNDEDSRKDLLHVFRPVLLVVLKVWSIRWRPGLLRTLRKMICLIHWKSLTAEKKFVR